MSGSLRVRHKSPPIQVPIQFIIKRPNVISFSRIELQKRLPWLAIKETVASDTQSNATGGATQTATTPT
jgi:hypothetical protein